MAQEYHKKFPIKTATACASKWAWSTIYLNKGSTASCHRVNAVALNPKNFGDFHNRPEKIRDRQLMLQGQWPSGGCEYCRHIEEAGGWSDRQHNNNIGGYSPIEIYNDPTEVYVTPTIVEIFAWNTCNLQCVYCNQGLSSRIKTENDKFGPIVFQNENLTGIHSAFASDEQIKKYYDEFINWVRENATKLKRLHLLGGETFIQHDLMNSILDIFAETPCPDLQLNIFSNFNAPEKNWYDYCGRIKDLCNAGHLGRFDLTCSIDCWGPEAEYVRSGLDLNRLESYLAWAADQSEDWLYLNINQTVSSMTIKTMPELIEKINQYNQKRHIGHYFMFVDGYKFQHPDIYDYSLWADDFERILSVMRDDTVDGQEAIKRMQGLQKRLINTCKKDLDQIAKLHYYLDELDARRNTNWRELFPYLIP